MDFKLRKVPQMISFLVGPGSLASQEVVSGYRKLFPKREIEVVHNVVDLEGRETLVALSYPTRVGDEVLSSFSEAYVIHASDLPRGRGWSPANWAMEALDTEITVTLLTMHSMVDRGEIIDQEVISAPIHFLWSDLEPLLINAQVTLLARRLGGETIGLQGTAQSGQASYLPRRSPRDSEIDPSLSIESQWGKFRASDERRFPNYFFLHGHKYEIRLTRLGSDENR
jgi:methionyl-tRNA formyltransferase